MSERFWYVVDSTSFYLEDFAVVEPTWPRILIACLAISVLAFILGFVKTAIVFAAVGLIVTIGGIWDERDRLRTALEIQKWKEANWRRSPKFPEVK